MVQDTVYSNLLPVRQMPRYVYGAPCLGEKESDVRPEGAPEALMTPFIVRDGWLWAFQDLRDEDRAVRPRRHRHGGRAAPDQRVVG